MIWRGGWVSNDDPSHFGIAIVSSFDCVRYRVKQTQGSDKRLDGDAIHSQQPGRDHHSRSAHLSFTIDTEHPAERMHLHKFRVPEGEYGEMGD